MKIPWWNLINLSKIFLYRFLSSKATLIDVVCDQLNRSFCVRISLCLENEKETFFLAIFCWKKALNHLWWNKSVNPSRRFPFQVEMILTMKKLATQNCGSIEQQIIFSGKLILFLFMNFWTIESNENCIICFAHFQENLGIERGTILYWSHSMRTRLNICKRLSSRKSALQSCTQHVFHRISHIYHRSLEIPISIVFISTIQSRSTQLSRCGCLKKINIDLLKTIE